LRKYFQLIRVKSSKVVNYTDYFKAIGAWKYGIFALPSNGSHACRAISALAELLAQSLLFLQQVFERPGLFWNHRKV